MVRGFCFSFRVLCLRVEGFMMRVPPYCFSFRVLCLRVEGFMMRVPPYCPNGNGESNGKSMDNRIRTGMKLGVPLRIRRRCRHYIVVGGYTEMRCLGLEILEGEWGGVKDSGLGIDRAAGIECMRVSFYRDVSASWLPLEDPRVLTSSRRL